MIKVISILFVLFLGCQTAPDLIKGEPEVCFYFRDCMYRNEKNKDKSICIDYQKECRNYKRYNFCLIKRDKNQKFSECWNYLKQL